MIPVCVFPSAVVILTTPPGFLSTFTISCGDFVFGFDLGAAGFGVEAGGEGVVVGAGGGVTAGGSGVVVVTGGVGTVSGRQLSFVLPPGGMLPSCPAPVGTHFGGSGVVVGVGVGVGVGVAVGVGVKVGVGVAVGVGSVSHIPR